MKRIACLFPGIGYTCDKPLLYYSRELLKSMDWEVLSLRYSGFPSGVKGNPEKMREAAHMALKQAEEQLRDIDWSAYADVLFVGKSVGTVVCTAYARQHGLSCRQVLFTPVEATFRFAEGKAIAEDVMHRHKVLKEFFAEVLGLPVAKASDAACHIEHVVDGDAIRRFVIFSEAIEHRSDAEKLRTYLSEAMSNLETTGEAELAVLSEFKVGDSLEVKRFGRNLSDTAKIGVSIGDRLTIEGVSLDKTSLRLSRGGVPMELPISIAENIWVTPVQ